MQPVVDVIESIGGPNNSQRLENKQVCPNAVNAGSVNCMCLRGFVLPFIYFQLKIRFGNNSPKKFLP